MRLRYTESLRKKGKIGIRRKTKRMIGINQKIEKLTRFIEHLDQAIKKESE